MHSKLKGNIGEAAIVKDLCKRGFFIFKELGDLSKIDLIAEKDGHLYRIQVKAVTSEQRATIALDSRKSGPNYQFKYTEDMVDIFAVYILDQDVVAYIPSDVFCSTKGIITFRIGPSLSNQKKKIRYLSLYSDFPYRPSLT